MKNNIKILIHLDPLDNDHDMILNRIDIYCKIMKELIEAGASTRLYFNSIHLSKIKDIFEDSLLIHDKWNTATPYGYKSLAYTNNLPENLMHEAGIKYNDVSFDPDIIITNTPSTLIRKKWKNKLILHYELGFFNRSPFPLKFQFDPIGYYHTSLLAKFPIIGEDGTYAQIERLEKQKIDILDSIHIKPSEIGSIDAVYFPLHSESWAAKTEINFSSQVEHLLNYAKNNKTTEIITNEKPQAPLTESQRQEVAKYKNISFIENDDNFGVGSKLALICKQTHTFSPSLGLQTIFWGNKLSCPIQSSMIGWATLKDPIRKLSYYTDYFHISNFKEILANIGIWNKYNPYTNS